jgi:GTP-binding protein EngB required for normal cell division
MGSRTVTGISAEELARRAEALESAVHTGGAELDPDAAARAEQVVAKVRERTGLTGGHTVVALAGATGSGKSSLFNAVVGADVAAIGARRPTTATPTAAVWGVEPVNDLLDWLGVGTRHFVDEIGTGREDDEAIGSLDGLVLLDLPDFDSREMSHRVEAERILELVDVFLWVTDPQKYADARLHDDFVAALATHETVMLVVLNQADRLTVDELQQCADDLRRLLARDGASHVGVLTTSALTGQGIAELRQRLANAVAGQNAARNRLAADVRLSGDRLRVGVADAEPDFADRPDEALVDALARSAGIPTVVAAVERDYRREAWARTGWPFTRWLRALKPDPLKRLRLDRDHSVGSPGVISAEDVRSVLGRSSLPPATPSARAAVDLTTRQLGDRAGEGLPQRWAEAVADAASPVEGDLADALDQAVMETSLRSRAPLWWTVFGILQVACVVVLVAGLLWLVILSLMGFLRLPDIETPMLGPLPWPLVMFAGGLLGGLLLALLARALARIGGRRRARRIDRRLRASVAEVATESLLLPVIDVLQRHALTRAHLDRARAV